MGLEITLGALVAAGVSWLLNRRSVKKHVPAEVARAVQDNVPALITDAIASHLDGHHSPPKPSRPPSVPPRLGKK